jgi:hypothetical protein
MAQTLGVMNGDLIGLYVNGQLVARGTDHKFSFKTATRETTSKDDVGWASFEPTKRSGDVSGSVLHAEDATFGLAQIFTMKANRQKFTVKFGSAQIGDNYFFATGFFTSLDKSAKANDNVTGSYTIQLTGQIQQLTN